MPTAKKLAILLIAHAMTLLPARADDWQRLADMIPWVDYGDFLYNRPPERMEKHEPRAAEAMRTAMAMEADLPLLNKLASHENPKVRTLALMRLYDSGIPQAFRIIHRLTGDFGAAFPAAEMMRSAMATDPLPLKVDTQPQTVGQVAGMMLFMVDCPNGENFDAWAAPRLNNPDWLGWYVFLFKRVTRGSSPAPDGIGEDLAALNRSLDVRPAALRTWLCLFAADEAMMVPTEDTVLATRDELIERCKSSLGHDALLTFLRDGTRAGLENPAVDASEAGKRFILRHAGKLFPPSEAEALRAMGYRTAASDVRPQMASTWIREALTEWNWRGHEGDRTLAMAALLHHAGEKEHEFVVKWFYDLETDASRSSDHTSFIKEYHRRMPADWRENLVALVAHPGFESLDSNTLFYIGKMIRERSASEDPLLEEFNRDDEAVVRNEIRRSLGLDEVPFKWLDLQADAPMVPTTWSQPFQGQATRVVVSADGASFAVAMQDSSVRVFRTADGELAHTIPAEKGSLATLQFHRDDHRLMLVRSTGIMEIWSNGKQLSKENIRFYVTEACLDPRGAWLTGRGAEHTGGRVGVTQFDLQSGRISWNFPMRTRGFGLFGATPDGSRFAVCNGFERTVWLFDPNDKQPIARLIGHSDVPDRVAFSSDGSTLATTGADTKILLWCATSGQKNAEFYARSRHPRVLASGSKPSQFYFGNRTGGIPLADLSEGRVVSILAHDGTWLEMMECDGGFAVALVRTQNGESLLTGWRFR